MKIATWNVNSLRARIERVQSWLEANQPDICCLQETKCADEEFPHAVFNALGYEVASHGNGRWNGVAIASRVGVKDARVGFAGQDPATIDECRILSADCGGIRVFDVYVPNGRSLDSPHFEAKLDFLERLRAELDACDATAAVLAAGDFNIAPEDRDVWDISQLVGATHVSPQERAALQHVMAWGLDDAFRAVHPDEEGLFSWWDYRQGAFRRGMGMRIDLILVSAPLLAGLREAHIDREERRGQGGEHKPSDHAPVVIDLTLS